MGEIVKGTLFSISNAVDAIGVVCSPKTHHAPCSGCANSQEFKYLRDELREFCQRQDANAGLGAKFGDMYVCHVFVRCTKPRHRHMTVAEILDKLDVGIARLMELGAWAHKWQYQTEVQGVFYCAKCILENLILNNLH